MNTRDGLDGGDWVSGDPVPTDDREAPSVQERNKDVIRLYFERCWNQRDFDFVDTIMVSDYDLHFDDGPGGRDAWKAGMRWIRESFPDMRFTLLSLVAEGDMVAVRSEVSGTHCGEFMGVPGTGRTFVARNADFYQLRGGKMTAHWDVNDFLSIVCQIGLIPDITSKVPPIFRRAAWPTHGRTA